MRVIWALKRVFGPPFATHKGMRIKSTHRPYLRHVFYGFAAASISLASSVGAAMAAPSGGGIKLADGAGGITDQAFITAPPHYAHEMVRMRGSFLDCGDGQSQHETDQDGRAALALDCGVTLSETMVIPAAATSARIIIRF